MDVALSYNRSRVEADATAAAVTAAGRRAHVASADLAKPEDCRALVDGAADAFGRLDVLINMASVYAAVPVRCDRRARVEQRWSTSTCARRSSARTPPCRTCAARAAGASSTSRTGSPPAAGRATPGYLPYYVAKTGVIALTEALALELAADQILVNAIAPGPIVAPPGTIGRRNTRPSRRRRRSAAGAARRRSRRPCVALLEIGLRHRRNHPRRRRAAPEVDGVRSGSDAAARCVRPSRSDARTALRIDSSAPVSSSRSRAKQKRM